jgi:hypothetical protein
MRKISLIMMICVCSAGSFAQLSARIAAPSASEWMLESPSFSWNLTTYDFGKIPLNKPVTHQFKFTNRGDVPLVISSVQASCGCTVTEYSKDPIAPGAEGFVKATYNAAKTGVFSKTVTVNANADESVVQLIIKGEVVE